MQHNNELKHASSLKVVSQGEQKWGLATFQYFPKLVVKEDFLADKYPTTTTTTTTS